MVPFATVFDHFGSFNFFCKIVIFLHFFWFSNVHISLTSKARDLKPLASEPHWWKAFNETIKSIRGSRGKAPGEPKGRPLGCRRHPRVKFLGDSPKILPQPASPQRGELASVEKLKLTLISSIDWYGLEAATMPQLKDIAIFRISGNVVPPVKTSGPKMAILIFFKWSKMVPNAPKWSYRANNIICDPFGTIFDHFWPF